MQGEVQGEVPGEVQGEVQGVTRGLEEALPPPAGAHQLWPEAHQLWPARPEENYPRKTLYIMQIS